MDAARSPSFQTTILIRDTCLCLHVQRAARVLARRFDDALRPFGLTNGQFSLLTALNRPGPATMRSVVNLLGMDRTTLTAALKPLERRGLVSVGIDPADRRNRLLGLTGDGLALLADATPVWCDTHAGVEMSLGGGAVPERLRGDLTALADGRETGGSADQAAR